MNIESCNFNIIVGNQKTIKYNQMGDLKVIVNNTSGGSKITTLTSVRYIPSFVGNLFSVSKIVRCQDRFKK